MAKQTIKLNESQLRKMIKEAIGNFYSGNMKLGDDEETYRDEYRGYKISIWKDEYLDGAWDNEILPPDSDVINADVTNDPNYSPEDYMGLVKRWIDFEEAREEKESLMESKLNKIVKETIKKLYL